MRFRIEEWLQLLGYIEIHFSFENVKEHWHSSQIDAWTICLSFFIFLCLFFLYFPCVFSFLRASCVFWHNVRHFQVDISVSLQCKQHLEIVQMNWRCTTSEKKPMTRCRGQRRKFIEWRDATICNDWFENKATLEKMMNTEKRSC